MIAAGLLALSTALIKLAGSDIPVAQILFIRQLGMLVLLAPALIRDFPHGLASKRPRLQLTRVFFALIALYGGFTAVVNMPLADATALGFAKSFFVTVFAIYLLHESVGPYRWVAVAVGFVGVAIMLKPGSEGFSVYGLVAVTGAAAAGIVMVIIRLLSRTETSNSILGYQVFGVGAAMLVPTLFQWVDPTPLQWLLLFSIGFVSFFAQKANIYAYTHGEASLLASLDYVRLLYAAVLGYFLFSQLPQTSTWIGAGIIVVASIFTVWREAKKKQTLARAPDGRGYNNS